VRELGPDQTLALRADLAASYQRAVVESLMAKLGQALERTGHRRLAIGGGVAANSLLRSRVAEISAARGLELKIPPPGLCTDNAAMIASAARFVPHVPYPEFLAFDAFARSAA
jgi:N6-L-threonylcarbamoyladenine synthase